eukprot:538131-Rhodomonas_salina.1
MVLRPSYALSGTDVGYAATAQYGLSKYTTPEVLSYALATRSPGVRRLAAELQLHYGDLGDEVRSILP